MPVSTARHRPGPLLPALTLLLAALLLGGASRSDVLAPLAVRLVALLAGLWLVWAVPGRALRPRWLELALLLALLALPLLQLVPLSYATWSQLPGRALPRLLTAALGPERPDRALSVAPDRTLNGLFALLPGIVAFLLGRQLDAGQRLILLYAAFAVALFGAVLGLAQVVGGAASPLYFYRITNADSSVGFFANANHHGLLLAAAGVFVLLWLAERVEDARAVTGSSLIAAAAVLAILFASNLGTGSRGGLLLAFLGVVGGAALVPWRYMPLRRGKVAGLGALLLAVAGGGVALLLSGRVLGDRFRLIGPDEGRIDDLPIFRRMIADFFPWGSGLGSLDPVYRSYEQPATLNFGYLNAAHNDYAQLAIEGGLTAMVLLAAFLLWFGWRAAAAWRAPATTDTRIARAAALIIGLALLHSAVDYPLRTAALSTLFGFLCGFLSKPDRAGTTTATRPLQI